MKVEIEEKRITTLLKIFYSEYFEEYLNHMIDGDKEQSVVTLFKGMEFFFKIVKDLEINFEYKDIEDFIIKEYENGDDIFRKLKEQYDIEYTDYIDKEKDFEDIFGCKIKEF